ncbi:hypothetical protein Btru_064985 [Bulinus truncatus]|nr:hypothetical protein Btru_064985 [Bulinus truncatus]
MDATPPPRPSFVKSDRPNQFPGLTVRYVRGADPIIKLLDENHNVVETLGIDKWNTDSVEEFFLEHLQR